ncbi:hypothetical protein SCA6_018121 [Theobroma cacao]
MNTAHSHLVRLVMEKYSPQLYSCDYGNNEYSSYSFDFFHLQDQTSKRLVDFPLELSVQLVNKICVVVSPDSIESPVPTKLYPRKQIPTLATLPLSFTLLIVSYTTNSHLLYFHLFFPVPDLLGQL